MIANAVVDIWQAEGVKPILKYEDDLKLFRYPVDAGIFQQDGFKYDYDRDEALCHKFNFAIITQAEFKLRFNCVLTNQPRLKWAMSQL